MSPIGPVRPVEQVRVPSAPGQAPGAEGVLAALPVAVLVADADGVVRTLNRAAERFFETGAAQLRGRPLGALIGQASPVLGLIDQALRGAGSVSAYGLEIETARVRRSDITVEAAPLDEGPAGVVFAFSGASGAAGLGRQVTQRDSARSVAAMASVLAHEVKNPLSGIRGAAQLLEAHARAEDKALAGLIRDEADRITGLLERMEMFSERTSDMGPVNIHEVLGRVRALAAAGFARDADFVERYDPSLPEVLGNRDQLIQVFLNLVKNAAEAIPERAGEIVIASAYHHGLRLARGDGAGPVGLPVRVSIEDNGPGVPDAVRPYLFDPFVGTKAAGQGLGLALAAKIVTDHGGIIELGASARGACFHVLLPAAGAPAGAGRGGR